MRQFTMCVQMCSQRIKSKWHFLAQYLQAVTPKNIKLKKEQNGFYIGENYIRVLDNGKIKLNNKYSLKVREGLENIYEEIKEKIK